MLESLRAEAEVGNWKLQEARAWQGKLMYKLKTRNLKRVKLKNNDEEGQMSASL